MARSDINCVSPSHHVCTATDGRPFIIISSKIRNPYIRIQWFPPCGTHDGNRKCVRQGGCETSKERIFERFTRLTLCAIRNEPKARCSSSFHAMGENYRGMGVSIPARSKPTLGLNNPPVKCGQRALPTRWGRDRNSNLTAMQSLVFCPGKFHNNLSVSSTSLSARNIYTEYQTNKGI